VRTPPASLTRARVQGPPQGPRHPHQDHWGWWLAPRGPLPPRAAPPSSHSTLRGPDRQHRPCQVSTVRPAPVSSTHRPVTRSLHPAPESRALCHETSVRFIRPLSHTPLCHRQLRLVLSVCSPDRRTGAAAAPHSPGRRTGGLTATLVATLKGAPVAVCQARGRGAPAGPSWPSPTASGGCCCWTQRFAVVRLWKVEGGRVCSWGACGAPVTSTVTLLIPYYHKT